MFHPRRRGRTTLCPRLETGKSSETPWSRPRTTACQYEMSAARGIGSAPGVRGALPAGLEPRVDEAREADEERRDPVLHVVVPRMRFVAGDPRGQRAGGLDPVDDCESDQGEADDAGERGEGGVPLHPRVDDTGLPRTDASSADRTCGAHLRTIRFAQIVR